MSDLDGFSVPNDYGYQLPNHYTSASNDDFGFDPPAQTGAYPKLEPYSPPEQLDPLQLSTWSGFEQPDTKDPFSAISDTASYDGLNRAMAQNLPNSASAIARFGQVTPPRSNSASSEEHLKSPMSDASRTAGSERKKRSSKVTGKDEVTPSNTIAATAGRKRKSTRKVSAMTEEQDDKRRQSLEKNRLAAAKCRVNKKEKTEQLQRDSHDKAVHNAFLKDQVMRMKEEVQRMNALLLAHANCEGCKSPEEIQKHLSNLGSDLFANHLSPIDYADYSSMNLSDVPELSQDPMMQPDYFAPVSGSATMLNPPLPDFDRAADFEVHTPMQTD